MKTNISLIGFMGTGKTRVYKRQTDDLIVKIAGKSILEIFEQDGESKFRELEMEAVRKTSDEKNIIIDCGGGIVLNKVNIDRLRKNSNIILLTASPEVILGRVLEDGEERPLLNTQDKLERIKKLLSFREPLYKKSADFEVDTSNLSVDQVVDKILEFLKKDSVKGG